MALKFTTNNHRREIIRDWQVPPAVREQFDYINWAACERGEDSASFVQYRGEWYDLGDVMRATGEIAAAGWDGFNSDSFFSGIAFKWGTDDSDEHVIIATVYAAEN